MSVAGARDYLNNADEIRSFAARDLMGALAGVDQTMVGFAKYIIPEITLAPLPF